MLIKKLLHAFLLFCLLTSPAFAATYYVRGDGHDTNCNGTADDAAAAAPNCAWLTIAHAADTVAEATHTISVSDSDGDGNTVYEETQIVLKEGVSLTSTSADNTTVTIRPSASMDRFNPLILLSSATNGDGSQTISYLEIDGINGANIARLGISIRSRDNVLIHHNNIHSFYGVDNAAGIQVISVDVSPTFVWSTFWVTDVQVPGTDTNINTAWTNAGLTNPVTGLKIYNNTIDDCGYYDGAGNSKGSILLWHIKDSEIYDNTFDNTNSLGQFITGRGGKTGIFDGLKIYNNTFVMGTQSAVKTNFMLEFWVTKNCEIYNNTGQGYYSITVSKNNKIYDNVITIASPESSYGIGIEATISSYLQIYGNFISGPNRGIDIGQGDHSGGGAWNTVNTIVRNNVIYDYNLNGVFLKCYGIVAGQSYPLTVSGFRIFNNVVDGNAGRGNSGFYIREYDVATSDCAMDDINVKNNVSINHSTNPGIKEGTVTNLVVNHNLYNGNTPNTWNGATDADPNTNDPAFTDEGANFDGYTPITGSTVIDDGLHLTNVNDGDDCVGPGDDCTAMIVADVKYFAIGNYVFVDAATDFIEKITAINYGTNTLTLEAAHDHEDGNNVYLSYSPTVGIMGDGPDLGAIEYDLAISGVLPVDGGTDFPIAGTITYTVPTAATTLDRYFDIGLCAAVCGDTLLNGGNESTALTSYDPPGDLVIDTDYCFRIDIDHAGGTETGNCYDFETTGGPPPPVGSKTSISYSSGGGSITHDDSGITIE